MADSGGIELSALAEQMRAHAPEVIGDGRTLVRDVCQDSREVREGALFAARRGERFDGLRFVERAVEAGARAIMTEADAPPLSVGVPQMRVADVAAALGPAAEIVHGRPSERLRLVGITGTNGKTTCVSLLQQCLDALGHPTAQLGTLGCYFGSLSIPGALTTPEPDRVCRFLHQALEAGAVNAVMEVSSHALMQRRVDGLRFGVAAFTNLTHDHLDYHGSLSEYRAAKARLFEVLEPTHRVINIDDDFGAELAARSKFGVLRVSRRSADADISCERVRLSIDGAEVTVNTPQGRFDFRTGLIGAHNVDNWLLTLGVLHALRMPLERLVSVAPGVRGAPGRMERCEAPEDDLTVLVDYAHTPDALEHALQALRALPRATASRLICVFGCGGDRDRAKRPLMGAHAARLSEIAIVTNDNPRSEAPATIAAEIEAGMADATAEVRTILDRRKAIFEAVSSAQPGDVVLIAGKGHEDYQLIGDQRLDFDDRIVARKALAARREGE
jgi:UDP-N-acetylmuramoyl-L-alanyl-D-glutamate--2,6-diaminopimelate ligase